MLSENIEIGNILFVECEPVINIIIPELSLTLQQMYTIEGQESLGFVGNPGIVLGELGP